MKLTWKVFCPLRDCPFPRGCKPTYYTNPIEATVAVVSHKVIAGHHAEMGVVEAQDEN